MNNEIESSNSYTKVCSMECYIVSIAVIAGFVMFIIPALFYVYERWNKIPFRWCLHKTFMLIIGLMICFALAFPALRILTTFFCHY